MYGDLNVVQRINLARLRWAGHVVRMETDNPARKIFLAFSSIFIILAFPNRSVLKISAKPNGRSRQGILTALLMTARTLRTSHAICTVGCYIFLGRPQGQRMRGVSMERLGAIL